MKQRVTMIKGETENNTVIVGDFNTPLKPIHRTYRQKINKITEILNDKVDLLEIIDIYRTLHPKLAEYTLISSVHRMFSSIDYIRGHTSLNKFKRIEITLSIFF